MNCAHMLRHPPKFTYIGLTIIMSNPSRHDTKELISATGGYFFNEECLRPHANRYQCDIRLLDDKSPLLPGTKCILLLGEKAHKLYAKADTSLDEGRGSPMLVDGIPCISSFTPQDCVDFLDYEKKYNDNYETVEEFMSDEIKAGEFTAEKSRTRTARSNYRFWLKHDTKRILKVLDNNGKFPDDAIPEPEYILRPSSEELIHILTSTKGDFFYYDMETDLTTADMRCFAFAFASIPRRVYIVPTLDLEYRYAYSRLPQIIRAKAIAIRDNTSVAYNGALFDFFIWAFKYRIPIGRMVYDPMVTQQRMFPDVEKSLGHAMTLATWQPYHKNEGVHSYKSTDQAERLYKYCGKDVYGMMLVHLWQMKQMALDEGLRKCVDKAQASIKPNMEMTYLGMKFDTAERDKQTTENDKLMTQYQARVIPYLTGNDDPKQYLISPQRCEKYFRDQLGYPVVKRNPETGAASYDEGALLMLKQKFPDNVVIDFLLKYRARKKETSDLKMKLWIE